MPNMAPLPEDHPLMIEWKNWKAGEDYANSLKWAAYKEHVEGSLWNAFMRGFLAARPDLKL